MVAVCDHQSVRPLPTLASEVEVVRLAALAREAMTHRRFERREPKPANELRATSQLRSVQVPKPIARPRVMRRRVPSLPTMPWQDDER
jgi:hypothetical protein